MSYWINIHWPPFAKDKPTLSSSDPPYHYQVYVPDGRQHAGRELQPGDYVFIYETKWGRPRKDGEKYAEPGRQGIIALVCALTPICEKPSEERDEYLNGRVLWWKWQAETQVKKLGFCPHDDVCKILEYSPNWTLYGFGDQHSGLKKIDEETFKTLLNCFRAVA